MLSSAIINGFEYFNAKITFKPWHTTPKHLLVLLDATSLGDINRSRRSIIWLQVGNLCDLQNNASVLWGVRYAKFWSHGSWRPIQFHKKTQRFRFSHIFLRCDLDHPTNFQNPPIRAFRDNIILLFSNGVDFHPALHFQEVFGGFWQISLNWSLYVKNWKKSFLRPLFRATFPLNTDLNSSSGSLWDPLEPSGTPLGTPLDGPRGSQRTNWSWSSTGKLLGIMVLKMTFFNF